MKFDFTWVIAILSVLGSFFNIKRKIVCFYLWIMCEIMCIIIDFKSTQYGRAFLDFFCILMNIYGIFAWSKDKNQKNISDIPEN